MLLYSPAGLIFPVFLDTTKGRRFTEKVLFHKHMSWQTVRILPKYRKDLNTVITTNTISLCRSPGMHAYLKQRPRARNISGTFFCFTLVFDCFNSGSTCPHRRKYSFLCMFIIICADLGKKKTTKQNHKNSKLMQTRYREPKSIVQYASFLH